MFHASFWMGAQGADGVASITDDMNEFHVGEVMEELFKDDDMKWVFKGDLGFLLLFKIHIEYCFCTGDEIKFSGLECLEFIFNKPECFLYMLIIGDIHQDIVFV